MLNKFGGRWVAELLTILWSLRMTPSRATGYTPFFMVYGAEVVLPTDLDYGASKVMQYREQEAKEYLENTLDQLDEARDIALLHSANTSRHYTDTIAIRSRAEPSTLGP
jgi:hypothetical protein